LYLYAASVIVWMRWMKTYLCLWRLLTLFSFRFLLLRFLVIYLFNSCLLFVHVLNYCVCFVNSHRVTLIRQSNIILIVFMYFSIQVWILFLILLISRTIFSRWVWGFFPSHAVYRTFEISVSWERYVFIYFNLYFIQCSRICFDFILFFFSYCSSLFFYWFIDLFVYLLVINLFFFLLLFHVLIS
jgi:hypothetical protein